MNPEQIEGLSDKDKEMMGIRKEQAQINANRVKTENDLVQEGADYAERTTGGGLRLEVTKEQNDAAYREMETKIGLNQNELLIAQEALRDYLATMKPRAELPENDDNAVSKDWLSSIESALSKIEQITSKRLDETADRELK